MQTADEFFSAPDMDSWLSFSRQPKNAIHLFMINDCPWWWMVEVFKVEYGFYVKNLNPLSSWQNNDFPCFAIGIRTFEPIVLEQHWKVVKVYVIDLLTHH